MTTITPHNDIDPYDFSVTPPVQFIEHGYCVTKESDGWSISRGFFNEWYSTPTACTDRIAELHGSILVMEIFVEGVNHFVAGYSIEKLEERADSLFAAWEFNRLFTQEGSLDGEHL